MTVSSAIHSMNHYGKSRRPFLFVIDFLMQQPIIIPLDEVNPEYILYNLNGFTNASLKPGNFTQSFTFSKEPPGFGRYQEAYHYAMKHLLHGNSFLLNLTMPTAIETNLALKEIFYRSGAAYKLWYEDKIVVFSPELFVKITNGRIESHPMKGTIDASVPDAENRILGDPKEIAEHNTIVDLIRNDLNRVARNVHVEKFRFVTAVRTQNKTLLQVSSGIAGNLDANYNENIGDLIFGLLPAGSISGAPKKKTIEVILESERYERGYYTGIFGIFDGHNLDSGVMIRFIENIEGKLFFKSGGGITVNSRCEDEYQELIDKVYLPFVSHECTNKYI
ncbi:MAG: aminodeoxychorismate synthase component I [Bacteroidales bacterium]|nr:aminodeoxychorismate synthase component I [Bacteroidales bacterium]